MSHFQLNNNEFGVWSEMPNELYVIGDIHGDFFALKQSLELTECVNFESYDEIFKIHEKKYYYLNDGCQYYSVNNNVKWNSNKKNCMIVFSGDLIDRCRPNIVTNDKCINTVSDENCDYLLLKLLFDLDMEAKKYNSRVIVILGNHEIMNLDNNFDYVSLKGRNDQSRKVDIEKYLKLNLSNIYGIIRINKYIIVHGGINDIFFTDFNKNKDTKMFESIELFNQELRNFILLKSLYNNKLQLGKTDYLTNNQSPFWDRTLGGRDNLNNNQCKDIFDNNLLKIKDFDKIQSEMKILVAHCPQFVVNQTINLVDCQNSINRIYRIDVGMSRAFDFYDINKIKNILNDNEFNNIFNKILNMNYKDFFIINKQTANRAVSCLKLTSTSEEILKGMLTIDYFYNLPIFKNNNNNIKVHILSDLIKIFYDNFEKKYILTDQNNYLNYINILKQLLGFT